MNISALFAILAVYFQTATSSSIDGSEELTEASEVLPTTQWPWHGSWFERLQFKLGVPNADNARQVLAVNQEDGSLQAVCDDLWTDKSAQALCKKEGFQDGRKASITTDIDFLYSSVKCYEKYDFVDLSVYEKPLFVIANAECSYHFYSADDVIPCSKHQAAAAYCYDDPWFNVFHKVQLTASKQDFSIRFMISFVKLGKFYDALAAEPLTDFPDVSQYSAVACGNNFELSLEKSQQENAFYLKGIFADDCDECFDILLDDVPLFHNICVNYGYD